MSNVASIRTTSLPTNWKEAAAAQIRLWIQRLRRAVDWFFEGLELSAPYAPYLWYPAYGWRM